MRSVAKMGPHIAIENRALLTLLLSVYASQLRTSMRSLAEMLRRNPFPWAAVFAIYCHRKKKLLLSIISFGCRCLKSIFLIVRSCFAGKEQASDATYLDPRAATCS
jgi:hypothetical protein